MRTHLYRIGDSAIGTGPFSDFITLYLLNPLRDFLVSWLSWPVIILTTGALASYVSGWRLALGSMVGMLLIGWLGMWELAMDTLSQTILAVVVALLIGIPLGVWAAHNDLVEKTLRPFMDMLQTIPIFVYLVPVIMLFNLGRVPGIIASILYALPPVVRLTSLGLRQVDAEAVEAAQAFGSTGWQSLLKVQLPLAMPSIMAGINQTMMMVLAMVVIAGLVGGGGLGYEVVLGLAQNEIGRGLESGLAIVILAIILDRITQAWAQKQKQAANL
jgi:glycine betaine/proline transport system permease protein